MVYLQQSILSPLRSAVEQSSDECCGFLFGLDLGEHRIISTILEVENEAFDRRRTFRISPRNYLKAENFAICNNVQLLGIYHSHPNSPAVPSEFDRAYAHPYFSYIIFSVLNKKVADFRSWNLGDNLQFEEESLAVLNINQDLYGYSNHPYPAA
jgi:proteasome lid subunit RPN8/RPN11